MGNFILLQFAGMLVALLLALSLVLSRVITGNTHTKYESARWMIFSALFLLTVHFLLQMLMGYRSSENELGMVLNMFFYAPLIFLVSYAVYYFRGSEHGRSRFRFVGSVLCICVMIMCIITGGKYGQGTFRSLVTASRIMFFIAVAYSAFTTLLHIRKVYKLKQTYHELLLMNARFARNSYVMLAFSVLPLAYVIESKQLLIIWGPVVYLSLFMFAFNFIAIGFKIPEVLREREMAASEINDKTTERGNQPWSVASPQPLLTEKQVANIKKALQQWVDDKGYCSTDVTFDELLKALSVTRKELVIYFDKYLSTNYRIWLSDLRLSEAKRILTEHPEYSNDYVSKQCGFASRSQLYTIFKQKEGISPREWGDKQKEQKKK